MLSNRLGSRFLLQEKKKKKKNIQENWFSVIKVQHRVFKLVAFLLAFGGLISPHWNFKSFSPWKIYAMDVIYILRTVCRTIPTTTYLSSHSIWFEDIPKFDREILIFLWILNIIRILEKRKKEEMHYEHYFRYFNFESRSRSLLIDVKHQRNSLCTPLFRTQ